MYMLLLCAILAQADQNKLVQVIFLQNHCCILRANIAQEFSCAMLFQMYFSNIECTIFLCRSSRPQMFCKKPVLKNFTKFTEKHLCQSLLLNKVVGLSPVTLSKRRLWHRYFHVNFTKFLRTPFFKEHVWATASVCNVFPAWQTQHCIGYFAEKSFLSTIFTS